MPPNYNYPPEPPQAKTPFEQTPEGAYAVNAWEWLVWAYAKGIPGDIDHMRNATRRDIRG